MLLVARYMQRRRARRLQSRRPPYKIDKGYSGDPGRREF
eukprot:gene25368-27475_t